MWVQKAHLVKHQSCIAGIGPTFDGSKVNNNLSEALPFDDGTNAIAESSTVQCTINPGYYVALRVILVAEREVMYTALLRIKSEFDSISVPLRARGGVVKLSHQGSLDFGDIACDHTYTRRLTLLNSGSIPCTVSLHWKFRANSREGAPIQRKQLPAASVLLHGTSTRLGRVRLWHWAIENVLALVKDRRKGRLNLRSGGNRGADLLQRLNGSSDLARARANRRRSSAGSASRKSSVVQGISESAATGKNGTSLFANLTAVGDLVGSKVERILDKFEKYQEHQSRSQQANLEKMTKSEVSRETVTGGNRIKTFLQDQGDSDDDSFGGFQGDRGEHSNKSNQQLIERELEDSGFSIPHVHVIPKTGTLSQRINMDIIVSLNCSVVGNFHAVLVVTSALTGVEPYEIPLSARPQEVLVVVDDPGTINFGRQALGEFKAIRRTFYNKGKMPATFRVRNQNLDLTVEPTEGVLGVGESVDVDFVYVPSSEALCAYPIYFETNCTAPLILDVYAGGGYPRLDLDHYEVFDFGRCMVGKSIPKQLRIGNSGNAVLSLTGFNFHDRRRHSAFGRGEPWPHWVEAHNPVRIRPGENFYLPLIFHPHSEERFYAAFTIQTAIGSFTIDLQGAGREAVLSLSCGGHVDFLDCIVGNAYQQSFEVSNAGDLNYPLEVSLVNFEGAGEGFESGHGIDKDADDKSESYSSLSNSKMAKAKKWSVLDDLRIEPKKMLIAPFEKHTVTVVYIPTRPVVEKTDHVRIALSSIFSNFDIPLKLVSGTADLQLEPQGFDFGHFERNKPAEKSVQLFNQGSMTFSLRIKRVTNGHFPFRLSRWEATLAPGQMVEIVCTYLHDIPMENAHSTALGRRRTSSGGSGANEGSSADRGVSESSTANEGGRRDSAKRLTGPVGAGGHRHSVARKDSYVNGMELGDFCEELLIETDLVGSVTLINVQGTCDASVLNSAEFSRVKLGHCMVGETASKTVTVTNRGGFPADIKLVANYPLKVMPKQLTIPGNESGSFVVSWRPMGSYELRSVVKISSNVGDFESNVWGIGVYPRFKLTNSRIEFGVCAPGNSYKREFSIKNSGRVPMEWSIPAIGDGYSVSKESGVLNVREESTIAVTFKPLDLGKYPGDFMVESQGRYKIVSVAGVGGLFDIELDPPQGEIEFGDTPCDTFSSRTLTVENRGGVCGRASLGAQAVTRQQPCYPPSSHTRSF